jgi:hypothetical protein
VTPLIGFAALSALIAWLVRRPSSELFAEADSYYAAAERWQRAGDAAMSGGLEELHADRKRDLCLRDGHALTRKALRRMPWKLL